MLTFTLHRASLGIPPTTPCFGRIEDDEHKQVCVTLERPWDGNQHDVSCIPPGTYGAHRYLSPKRGYEVFLLDGVPNRSSIELHIGCLLRDSDGCILLGSAYGWVDYADGKPDASGHGITGSHEAFTRFMNMCAGEQNIVLVVTDPGSGAPDRSQAGAE